jgi:hypothetical protein
MLTGMSLPVARTSRDAVIGATINRTRTLLVGDTAVSQDTTLAQNRPPERIMALARRPGWMNMGPASCPGDVVNDWCRRACS